MSGCQKNDRESRDASTAAQVLSGLRCFVAQPFSPRFDKRYEDVVEPAIVAAGFQAYRVDRDPSVQIPIETIEAEIRRAAACVVEISEDNPNVWFELGLALAAGTPTVMMCERARRPALPFDVRHRNVLLYETDSPRDFADLGQTLQARLKALPRGAPSTVLRIALGIPENRVLRKLAEGDMLTPEVSPGWLMTELEREGLRPRELGIAIQRLLALDLVVRTAAGEYGDRYEYALTPEGQLRVASFDADADFEDEIPF